MVQLAWSLALIVAFGLGCLVLLLPRWIIAVVNWTLETL